MEIIVYCFTTCVHDPKNPVYPKTKFYLSGILVICLHNSLCKDYSNDHCSAQTFSVLKNVCLAHVGVYM